MSKTDRTGSMSTADPSDLAPPHPTGSSSRKPSLSTTSPTYPDDSSSRRPSLSPPPTNNPVLWNRNLSSASSPSGNPQIEAPPEPTSLSPAPTAPAPPPADEPIVGKKGRDTS